MLQVDFYVLSQGGEQARQIFACKLAEKAYRLKNSVHIETASEADSAKLDTLLWTFRDGSFVPHHVLGAEHLESPVTIGHTGTCGDGRDLLINLTARLPDQLSAYARIAELVSPDEESKRASRQRFATYRDQGHQIRTHTI
ncbi:MAG TPA: DNA polymerase III subunit chi [Woeseiaceae bacterium]|nr:DNA polymerase III subunit chi [Woeseiaceae bacterium]